MNLGYQGSRCKILITCSMYQGGGDIVRGVTHILIKAYVIIISTLQQLLNSDRCNYMIIIFQTICNYPFYLNYQMINKIQVVITS